LWDFDIIGALNAVVRDQKPIEGGCVGHTKNSNGNGGENGRTKAGLELAEFVRRVMEEKKLTAFRVQKASGNSVSDSYVLSIVQGRVKQPSVQKLKGLASGLGIPEEELFRAAGGVYDTTENPWPGRTILHVMEKIMSSSDLTEIVKVLTRMSDKRLGEVRKLLARTSNG
jgi:transcriptional regulator with XRE-family HTH domain